MIDIEPYLKRGYKVTYQDADRVQLVKPKTFSLGWALFWFLFFGIGIVVYLLYYLSQTDEVLVLNANAPKPFASCCGKDYDKTWKICLYCKKPLQTA